MAFDFIAVGDAGIDTLVALNEAHIACSINKEDCQICLQYAEKILVDGIVSKTAYNGMNAAIGAARLGLKTGLFATVGDDHGGQRIVDVLKREKVSPRYVNVLKKHKSNASVVLNYQGERTILVFHEDYHYKLPKLESTKWFYLTTMGKRFLPVYLSLARVVKQSKAKLSFNPGSHQLKFGARKLKPVLEATSVLFLNKEEARLFTRISEEDDIKQLLRAMTKLGPEIAVITDGPKGSYVFDGEAYFRLPIFPAPIVERTGAGDSFGTAFTAALCNGQNIREAMRWGTMNSAGVIQKIGPQDGLLTIQEMRKALKNNPRFQPKAL
jgi:sugar/nucleoside kinase (ribokinase family)